MAFKTNILIKKYYLNSGVKSLNFSLQYKKHLSNLKIKKLINHQMRKLNVVPIQLQTKASNFNLLNY
jgi:hypothetical protein